MNFNLIYEKLLKNYSYQGWWPIINFNGINPTKTGSITGYHPKNYNFPRNDEERFEIIIGAILTQNTSWPSVEKSLINLREFIDFNAYDLLELANFNEEQFKIAIRPAGYYNQKFNYLQNIANFYLDLEGRTPSRKEILGVKGVGNETADSILLYAYGEKEFVVDAYTKRIFSYLGYFDEKNSYLKIKQLFENNFDGGVQEYQEYHALIVEHAKRYYSKKPYGVNDNILRSFKPNI